MTKYTQKRNSKVTGKLKRLIISHIKDNTAGSEPDFSRWYVGISKDVDKRIMQHIRKKKISGMFFNVWYAHSFANANDIESWFSREKGTHNAPHKGGATEDSKWVYCFKVKPDFIDELIALIYN